MFRFNNRAAAGGAGAPAPAPSLAPVLADDASALAVIKEHINDLLDPTQAYNPKKAEVLLALKCLKTLDREMVVKMVCGLSTFVKLSAITECLNKNELSIVLLAKTDPKHALMLLSSRLAEALTPLELAQICYTHRADPGYQRALLGKSGEAIPSLITIIEKAKLDGSLNQVVAVINSSRTLQQILSMHPGLKKAGIVGVTKDVAEFNPYEVLGIAQDATAAEIKAAYKRQALVCHPDKVVTVAGGSRMKDLNKAYNILRDPCQRAEWDLKYGDEAAAALRPR